MALFVEKGFAATRSDEVARAAGVAKGTLYLYYPSKEELFKAVVRHNVSGLLSEVEALVARYEGGTPELLRNLMQIWWERFGNTPASGIHKVMVAEVRNFPELAQFYSDEVIDRSNRLLSAVVQRGIDRGEFRPVPVHEVAVMLVMPIIFLALHRHSFGCCQVEGSEMDPMSVMRTHMDVALRGLAAPAGEGQANVKHAA